LNLEGVIIFENIMLYQVLVIIIAILAIWLVYKRFHAKKTSLNTFVLWTLLWIILGIFAFVPESTAFFAEMLGIGSGLNLILIFGIIGAYYLIFRVYLRVEALDRHITELVRKIAIDKEIKYKEDSEDNED